MSTIRWDRLPTPTLFIVILCILFYVFVLFMLITSRKPMFRKAYFAIFIYTGIVDISLAIAVQLFRATRRLGLGPVWEKVGISLSYFTGTNFSMHVFGNFLLTFCQYTAVCWPWQYTKIWEKPRIAIYLVLVTLISLASYAEVFRTRRVYTQMEDGSYTDVNVAEMPSLYVIGALTSVFYLSTSLFMVVRTLIAIRSVTNVENSYVRRQDKSLTFVALVDCVVFSADLLFEAANLFGDRLFSQNTISAINSQYDFYLAVMYCMNPIVLMLLNRSARAEVFRVSKVKIAACLDISPPTVPLSRPKIASKELLG